MQPETEDYLPGDAAVVGAAAEEYFDEDFDYEAYAEGLESEDWSRADGEAVRLPVLAVVGRPNVGKSTLVNRILGRREAVVQDVPGVTRDRVSYDALWNGRRFTVVDTGGWEPGATGPQGAAAAQAEPAKSTSDAGLLVV